MYDLDWTDLATFAVMAAGSALLLWQWMRHRSPTEMSPAARRPHHSQPVFLIEDRRLIDATPTAAQLISGRSEHLDDLDALIALLRDDFPTLADVFDGIADQETVHLTAMNGQPLTLTLARSGAKCRITLGATDGEDVDMHYAALARTATGQEMAMLRELTNAAPQMMWREDGQRRLIWANAAYMAMSDRVHAGHSDEKVWPSDPLFPDLSEPDTKNGSPVTSRHALKIGDEQAEHWFDITTIRTHEGLARFAVDANAVVRAENTRREFMQTLSKTFAQLSAGLAIFDQRRRLTMFNPAFLDMTGLPFDFLSSHPTIDTLLNRLRDLRRLPEPKNYASWRDQFLSLEAEAKRGTYAENWNLPDGQTLRVTGRPHPDGALAFMFEDISAEVSLTRHFRSELETCQAVIDSLPEAIAVFSPANTLVLTNKAYRTLWEIDADDTLESVDLITALRQWKSATIPSPVWPRVETFATTFETRRAWSDQITLLDGRVATCQAKPLSGRMTMIQFQIESKRTGALQSLVRNSTHDAKLAKR